MKLLLKCFTCCKKKHASPPAANDLLPAAELSAEQQQPIPKVHIDSKFRVEDVKLCEYTPSNTQKASFSYNCPICLRYFSTILVLKCCKQYICHFCLDDLSKNEKFEIACPHCKAVPVTAGDVDFNSTVKKYFDSPYGTLKQTNNRNEQKWVELGVVKENNEYEESVNAEEVPNLSYSHEPLERNPHMVMTA